MKVILISGKARAGKDQSALFVKEYIEKSMGKTSVIIKYGDFIKSFLINSIGWNGEKDENGRTLLQQWGTDIIRSNYNNTFTDMMIALLKGLGNTFDYCLISDVRFPNEVDEIKKLFNCILIRVFRNNRPLLTKDQMNHPSETAMDNYPCDCYIYNNFDLKALKDSCANFCRDYLEV